MTRGEGMALLDRYVHAGYRVPDDMQAAFEEWYAVFGAFDAEAVQAAVSRLVRERTTSFWPTPGELRAHLGAVTAGQSRRRCVCDSGWVEAAPFRANGGHIYEAVQRCPTCAKPVPDLAHLAGHQTPLSAVDYRAWVDSRRPQSEAKSASEVLAVLRGLVARANRRRRAQAAMALQETTEAE